MKTTAILGAILVAGFATDAMAICGTPGDNHLNQNDLQTALSGKRISALAPSGETWNEDHCAGGNLYKVGAGTVADPRALRGTWQIIGTGSGAQVRYTYSGGSNVYTWDLWQRQSTTTVDFCNGSTLIATITSTGAAGTCP